MSELLVEETEEIVEEAPSGSKRVSNSYTFLCTKCKKNITVNSDMFSKESDKRAMHSCKI